MAADITEIWPVSMTPASELSASSRVVIFEPSGSLHTPNTTDTEGNLLCPLPYYYTIATQSGGMSVTFEESPEDDSSVSWSGSLEYFIEWNEGTQSFDYTSLNTMTEDTSGPSYIPITETDRTSTVRIFSPPDDGDGVSYSGTKTIEVSSPLMDGDMRALVESAIAPFDADTWPMGGFSRISCPAGKAVGAKWRWVIGGVSPMITSGYESRWSGKFKLLVRKRSGTLKSKAIVNSGSVSIALGGTATENVYCDARGTFSLANWDESDSGIIGGAYPSSAVKAQWRFLSLTGLTYRVTLDDGDDTEILVEPSGKLIKSDWQEGMPSGYILGPSLKKLEIKGGDGSWTETTYAGSGYNYSVGSATPTPLLLQWKSRPGNWWGFQKLDGPPSYPPTHVWPVKTDTRSLTLSNMGGWDDFPCSGPLGGNSVSYAATAAWDPDTGRLLKTVVTTNTASRGGSYLAGDPQPARGETYSSSSAETGYTAGGEWEEDFSSTHITTTISPASSDKWPNEENYDRDDFTSDDIEEYEMSGVTLDGYRFFGTSVQEEIVSDGEVVQWSDFRLVRV